MGGRRQSDLRGPPPVVYEDEHLIAFAKPSGLAVVPDRWDRDRVHLMALVHAALSPDIFNAHRLDRDTSGVLLCARTPATLRALTSLFEQRAVEKTYLALVRPAPVADEGEITAPLAPDPRRPGRMRIAAGGKESATAWSVRERWRGGWALLEARPLTGRTHQVRVHLAHVGSPVVADPVYGDGRPLLLSSFKRGYRPGREPERPLLARLGLHAARLALAHPITGERLEIAAPLPADLSAALAQLRRHAG